MAEYTAEQKRIIAEARANAERAKGEAAAHRAPAGPGLLEQAVTKVKELLSTPSQTAPAGRVGTGGQQRADAMDAAVERMQKGQSTDQSNGY